MTKYVKKGRRYIVGYNLITILSGWLLLSAGGVYFMVLLGGYTRLTHSGNTNIYIHRPIND